MSFSARPRVGRELRLENANSVMKSATPEIAAPVEYPARAHFGSRAGFSGTSSENYSCHERNPAHCQQLELC